MTMRDTIRDGTAVCMNCGWKHGGEEAMKLGQQHAAARGHRVSVRDVRWHMYTPEQRDLLRINDDDEG